MIKPDEVMFVLTMEDVYNKADEIGVAREMLTDDVVANIKKGIESGLGCWDEVVGIAIEDALAPNFNSSKSDKI